MVHHKLEPLESWWKIVTGPVRLVPSYHRTIVSSLQCCSSSCVINLGDTMLITGGALGAENRVSEYSEAGYLRDLPPLIVGRYYHGCSYYHNDQGVKTFLVTGGYYKGDDDDDDDNDDDNDDDENDDDYDDNQSNTKRHDIIDQSQSKAFHLKA